MRMKQIDEHLQEVMKHAVEIVKVTGDKIWQDYKKVIAEQDGSQIPKAIEENVRAVFNYAYGQGICVGIEDKTKQNADGVISEERTLRQYEISFLEMVAGDWGEFVMAEFEEQDTKLQYGDFVILPYWKQAGLKVEEAVFRLLQIREGQAKEDTNLLIGRLADGRILDAENTPILMVKKKYVDGLTFVYNSHDAIEIDDDHKDMGYTINGVKKVGFFIPSSEF